jgi:hypothetical protein
MVVLGAIQGRANELAVGVTCCFGSWKSIDCIFHETTFGTFPSGHNLAQVAGIESVNFQIT